MHSKKESKRIQLRTDGEYSFKFYVLCDFLNLPEEIKSYWYKWEKGSNTRDDKVWFSMHIYTFYLLCVVFLHFLISFERDFFFFNQTIDILFLPLGTFVLGITNQFNIKHKTNKERKDKNEKKKTLFEWHILYY